MKHIFLVNSFSLKEKTSLMINKINKYAIDNNMDFLIEVNDINNSTEDIIKKYKRGENIIYAIGGDGVINRVLNSVIGTKNILGFIPCGTGNDLYSSVKETFEDGIHEVDTIKINNKFFINVACFGIDADIANNEEVVHSKFIPKSQRYNASVLSHFFKFIPKYFKIDVNDETYEGVFSTVCVCNGGYYGGGFHVNPIGKLNDDMFDVVIVDKVKKLNIIKYALKMKKGTHLKLDFVKHMRAKAITIKSNKNIKANIDGELLESDKFVIKMYKEKVKVYYNEKLINELKKI